MTTNKETAIRMARKKARLFGGEATLITYEWDESARISDMKIKVFPETACVEWFLFVEANRNRDSHQPVHDFDIVIGPIADDGVVLQLTNFREGIYSAEEAAKLLQDKYLDQQYCFTSNRALRFLKKTNTTMV